MHCRRNLPNKLARYCRMRKNSINSLINYLLKRSFYRRRKHVQHQNLLLQMLSNPNPKDTSTALPSSEPEKAEECTNTLLPSHEFEESVEYIGKEFTYDSPNGISLHFPTIVECEEAIKISIKVVNDDYILPEGYEDMELVSSMFKITASADLSAPVTVRMEHCAVVEEDDSLVHMIAHGPPPYKFKPLEGGKFQIGRNYGEFHTKAFSLFSIFSRKGEQRLSLSVQVFYHNKSRAVIVVTRNLKPLISAVEQKYPNAKKYLEQSTSCISSTKAIIFTMPPKQKVLSGWLVEPDIDPAQIEMQDIIDYEAGMTPPNVHLTMKWKGRRYPIKGSIKIDISGAAMKTISLMCQPHSSLHHLLANPTKHRIVNTAKLSNCFSAVRYPKYSLNPFLYNYPL